MEIYIYVLIFITFQETCEKLESEIENLYGEVFTAVA